MDFSATDLFAGNSVQITYAKDLISKRNEHSDQAFKIHIPEINMNLIDLAHHACSLLFVTSELLKNWELKFADVKMPRKDGLSPFEEVIYYYENSLKSLSKQLSVLGENLATRIDLEDKFINQLLSSPPKLTAVSA